MARTEWSDMGQIDGELEAILAKLPVLPPTPPTIEAPRMRFQDLKSARMAAMPPLEPIADVSEMDKKVTARDGFQISIIVYQPKHSTSKGRPLILLFHGTGFSLGGLENEEANCREVVQRLGAVAENLKSLLAPENPFPATPNNC
ncbi:hypothetical protein BKA56DRAFT_679425 [Ilyonectria sp. MPI-CAGE-AT-0026]|nr:hypothetical protein BKA56DRAFT_679425 [Ilyonectria sp. MPI-CAGE-AT-0026]